MAQPAIVTLQDTLAAQRDLLRLCADRRLETREIFEANAYYGMDAVLKRYAGLPRSYALKAVVPHGPHLMEDWVWEHEAQALLPVVWCYPAYRARAYGSRTSKKVVLAASPFVYVAELLKRQTRPARRGTLFFPAHSTHWNTANMDFELLAEELTRLEDRYQPVTVCLYWRDINLGQHLPFKRRGLPIVSAGHIYDADFLYRFYHLCSLHQYAAGNGLGSQMFYSVKAGCSYFWFDKVGHSYTVDRAVHADGLPTVAPATEAELKSLFGVASPATITAQQATADFYLGAGYLKTPAGLRRQFLHAEALDKFGVWVRNDGGAHFTVPTQYRRHLRKVISWLPETLKQALKRHLLRRPGETGGRPPAADSG